MGRHREHDLESGGQRNEGPRVSLLGGFRLEDEGAAIVLPEGAQRLLAFLALRGRLVRRPVVAGTLWPVATESIAFSSLHTALTPIDSIPCRAADARPGPRSQLRSQVLKNRGASLSP